MPIDGMMRDLSMTPTARLLALVTKIERYLVHESGALQNSRVRVLRCIEQSGRRGLTQVDVAQQLGISHPSVSKLLDELDRSGLVKRTEHAFDRRMKSLQLTEAGQEQLRLCSVALVGIADTVGGKLTATEIETLLGLLEKVAGGLSTPDRAASCRLCRIGGC